MKTALFSPDTLLSDLSEVSGNKRGRPKKAKTHKKKEAADPENISLSGLRSWARRHGISPKQHVDQLREYWSDFRRMSGQSTPQIPDVPPSHLLLTNLSPSPAPFLFANPPPNDDSSLPPPADPPADSFQPLLPVLPADPRDTKINELLQTLSTCIEQRRQMIAFVEQSRQQLEQQKKTADRCLIRQKHESLLVQLSTATQPYFAGILTQLDMCERQERQRLDSMIMARVGLLEMEPKDRVEMLAILQRQW